MREYRATSNPLIGATSKVVRSIIAKAKVDVRVGPPGDLLYLESAFSPQNYLLTHVVPWNLKRRVK